MKLSAKEKDRIRRVCMLLREADRPVRIMRAFLWPPETRERFFAKKRGSFQWWNTRPSIPAPPWRP